MASPPSNRKVSFNVRSESISREASFEFPPSQININQSRKPSMFRGKPKFESITTPVSPVKPGSLPPLATTVSSPPADPTKSAKTIQLRKGSELSNFMVSLYKKPAEKTDVFENSFASFRSLANMHPKGLGDSHIDDLYLPSNRTAHKNWKVQLEFNKKQEQLFKGTINEIFLESQKNFFKLTKEKELKKKMMPRVKIHSPEKFFNPLHTLAQSEEDLPSEGAHVYTEPHSLIKPKEKIPEYTTRIRLGKDDSYKFYVYPQSDPSLRKPDVREGASFNVIGKRVYLYGGLSKELHNGWEALNTNTYHWEKVHVKGDIPPYGRYGHSADVYLSSIIIFAGEKNYNATLNIREVLSDVRQFIPETKEWRYLKCQGEFIEPRRNHVGIVVGRHLLVHGGIDAHGNFLNDLKALDLLTHNWSAPQETGTLEHGVAFQRACLVTSIQRKEINLFKMGDFKFDENYQQIKEEGIYFFGGKNEHDEPINTLRVLKIGNTPLRWITPITQGQSPEPRFLHTMVHSKRLNMLIVYGGRNDNFYQTQQSPFLGDFAVLQLENLTWVSVVLSGETPRARCSHSATVLGTKLLIFGGINFSTYCSPNAEVMEMDQMIVDKLEKEKRKLESPDREDSPVSSQKLDVGLQAPVKHYRTMMSFLPMPGTGNIYSDKKAQGKRKQKSCFG